MSTMIMSTHSHPLHWKLMTGYARHVSDCSIESDEPIVWSLAVLGLWRLPSLASKTGWSEYAAVMMGNRQTALNPVRSLCVGDKCGHLWNCPQQHWMLLSLWWLLNGICKSHQKWATSDSTVACYSLLTRSLWISLRKLTASREFL